MTIGQHSGGCQRQNLLFPCPLAMGNSNPSLWVFDQAVTMISERQQSQGNREPQGSVYICRVVSQEISMGKVLRRQGREYTSPTAAAKHRQHQARLGIHNARPEHGNKPTTTTYHWNLLSSTASSTLVECFHGNGVSGLRFRLSDIHDYHVDHHMAQPMLATAKDTSAVPPGRVSYPITHTEFTDRILEN
ncbi:hypothetical protein BDD12DRAFT_801832 [Trichophaea hybrida]|nr:hypothetical protein BDD12DRAFT_801832 [Trichophaea hybrida]